jgi:hypothetical protein
VSPGEYEQLVQFLGPRFEAIDRRLDRIEAKADDFRREVLGHFDEIYRRLERLEQENAAVLNARIQDIERRLSS